jgi:hypothetical protein
MARGMWDMSVAGAASVRFHVCATTDVTWFVRTKDGHRSRPVARLTGGVTTTGTGSRSLLSKHIGHSESRGVYSGHLVKQHDTFPCT